MPASVKQILSDLQKLERLFLLPPGVRAFLRERVTPVQAAAEIRRLFDQREDTFLRIVKKHVFEASYSPYRPLFRAAGCEFSDLQSAVRQHGLEGALTGLAQAGVYLTSEEFKGKIDIVRGGIRYRVSPRDFNLSNLGARFTIESSGTVNAPVSSTVTLGWLAARTPGTALFFAAHDLFGHSHAFYDAILPADGGMNNVLINARLGVPPKRWFARRIGRVTHAARQPFHYLTTQLIVQSARTKYPSMARPEFIDLDDLGRIVDWVLEEKRAGKLCCISTAASNAVRIARLAADRNVALEETFFIATGEPLTEAKQNEIQRVGARVATRYAYGSSIGAGLGCGTPADVDDAHLLEYLLAFIPHPQPIFPVGPSIHPLLFTTVHPLAPRILINASNGDYGVLERKSCGCPLGEAGLTLHIHRIRSFEKLTSEGMTYAFVDLYDVMDRILPEEFGGGPGDYQLVEEEDMRGQTRLTLRVHPSVGVIEDDRLRIRLYEILASDGLVNASMTYVWREAEAVRITREAPHASPRGKVLPLHIIGNGSRPQQ
jgi:hypothetical protein